MGAAAAPRRSGEGGRRGAGGARRRVDGRLVRRVRGLRAEASASASAAPASGRRAEAAGGCRRRANASVARSGGRGLCGLEHRDVPQGARAPRGAGEDCAAWSITTAPQGVRAPRGRSYGPKSGDAARGAGVRDWAAIVRPEARRRRRRRPGARPSGLERGDTAGGAQAPGRAGEDCAAWSVTTAPKGVPAPRGARIVRLEARRRRERRPGAERFGRGSSGWKRGDAAKGARARDGAGDRPARSAATPREAPGRAMGRAMIVRPGARRAARGDGLTSSARQTRAGRAPARGPGARSRPPARGLADPGRRPLPDRGRRPRPKTPADGARTPPSGPARRMERRRAHHHGPSGGPRLTPERGGDGAAGAALARAVDTRARASHAQGARPLGGARSRRPAPGPADRRRRRSPEHGDGAVRGAGAPGGGAPFPSRSERGRACGLGRARFGE